MTDSLWRSLRQQIQSWFIQTQAKVEADEDWVALPDTTAAQLWQKVAALASPNAYQTTVHKAVTAAVQDWQQHLDAPNSLVIVGSPVEPMANILNDSLQAGIDRLPLQMITPFPCGHRLQDPLTICDQIQAALAPYPQIDTNQVTAVDDPETTDGLDQRYTLVVIPCLEQYFLRCIGGWDSIELLRNSAIHNPHCFWLIGCNRWAWDYLNFVCQIGADFSEVQALPQLDAAALQEWLGDLANPQMRLRPTASERQNSPTDTDATTVAERSQSYWATLASQSEGISQVAAHLWLQSLRTRQGAVNGESTQTDQTADQSAATSSESLPTLYQVQPSLPPLPSLTPFDRYLLHAILIHGSMTRPHLALSLGEAESQIQSRIQWLLRAGILKRYKGALTVKASHYVKLKVELANNSFLVGHED